MNESTADISSPARSLRRLVQFLLLAFVVHTFVIAQIGGARTALSTVSGVSPILLVAALALEAAAIVAYGAMTTVLLPPSPRVTVRYCSAVALASIGINHIVPGGAATTAAVNYRLFARAGISGPPLAFALAAQAIGSALILNVMLWLALLASIPASGFHPIYATAAAVGAVLLAMLGVAVIGMRRGRDGFARSVARILGRLPRVHEATVEQAIHDAGERMDVLAADPALIRRASLLATLNWLLDAAALWTMLTAFGHRPGIVGLMVAYGLANVMAAVPITPGGLGVVEAILIPTLVGFGTPASTAAVGVVAYRLVSFWLPIPTGLAAYELLRRHSAGRDLDEERDAVSVGGLLNDLAEARGRAPRGSSCPTPTSGPTRRPNT